MEATGVYWKPVWHVLSDGEFTLILANAAHVKNVPGRKTDVADALWLADLLAHGLIRPSFVPEAPTQDLRALLRTRKQLVRERGQSAALTWASHVQRIQKTLEDANLKLGSVLTQIMGKSGRAIMQALIDGERNADKLLTLVQRGVKAPPETLRAALQGRVTVRHRFLLRLHLRQVDALAAAMAEIDAEVDRDLDPFRQAVRLLRTIPGVSDLTAQVIVSGIGVDMSRFPTAGHLISWAGLCPRNDESAGKRRSARLRKGAPGTASPCLPPADRFAMA
jgi:transposase